MHSNYIYSPLYGLMRGGSGVRDVYFLILFRVVFTCGGVGASAFWQVNFYLANFAPLPP